MARQRKSRVADRRGNSRLKHSGTKADCKKCSAFDNFVSEFFIDAEAIAGKLSFRFSKNFFRKG
jgi:hypothetical protein